MCMKPKLTAFFSDKPDWRRFMVMFFLILVSTIVVIVFRESSLVEIPPSPENRRKGSENPKMTIMEFSDFSCPACALAHSYVSEVLKIYKNEIQLNFKYFPLETIHPNSFAACINAECAARQGKFWEFADILFREQKNWVMATNFQDIFYNYARTLGINLQDFKKCLNSKEIPKIVKLDMSYGDLKKVDATPTFFINNERAVGAGQVMQKILKYSGK